MHIGSTTPYADSAKVWFLSLVPAFIWSALFDGGSSKPEGQDGVVVTIHPGGESHDL